jgi:hypothetical protein
MRLLEMLVGYYPDIESFNIDGEPLRIEVEDIHFLTSLSDQGGGSGMKI